MAIFNPDTTTMMDARTGKIPEHWSDNIITDVKTGSAYMQLAKAVPMTKPIEVFTHLSGVGAYWVDEAKRIETSKPTWLQMEMRAHKLAVIVPATKETLNYSVNDFFSYMKPEIGQAFYKKFDSAAFAGADDSPWDYSILSKATAEGNVINETSNKYDDISNAMGLVEDADMDPNGAASTRKQKKKYRATKDENGLPIFNDATKGEPATVADLPVAFFSNAVLSGTNIGEIVADWDNAYYGILKDIEYEILTEATLTTVKDEEGNPLSLAERDMVALKATMTIGYMIVKDDAFAVVLTGSGGTGETGGTENPEDEGA